MAALLSKLLGREVRHVRTPLAAVGLACRRLPVPGAGLVGTASDPDVDGFPGNVVAALLCDGPEERAFADAEVVQGGEPVPYGRDGVEERAAVGGDVGVLALGLLIGHGGSDVQGDEVVFDRDVGDGQVCELDLAVEGPRPRRSMHRSRRPAVPRGFRGPSISSRSRGRLSLSFLMIPPSEAATHLSKEPLGIQALSRVFLAR
ncbi:hypothetical protein ACFWZK_24245 [[Kitasatospora] papulosa]|uniref:hypothetical protein n=1 Tax=[Kitasatospora] papulosa TaxID=1464011 RepID=UPI00367AA132